MKHFYASLLAALTLTPAMAIDLPSEPPVMVNFANWNEDDFKKNFVIENANFDNEQFKWIPPGGQLQRSRNTVGLFFTTISDANDWVITSKPVKLIAGLKYKLVGKASAYNPGATYTETVGMYVGTGPKSADMTQVVIKPTMVSTKFDAIKELTGEFTVEADGDYYIGFVCKTPKNGGYWCAYHGFDLTAQGTKGQPMTPDAPKVVTDRSGKTEVKITGVAPTVDITGTPIKTITSMRIYRDGERIGEWTDVAPGGTTSEFIDNDTDHKLISGAHSYTLEVITPEGTSEISDATTVYVGINEPGVPTNPIVRHGSKDGEVTITWHAPALDKDGYPQNGDVTYAVYAAEGSDPLADNLTTTTFTHQAANAADTQKLFSYRVYAKTTKGRSARAAETANIPAGKALTTPYAESFANGQTADVIDFVNKVNGQFKLYSDTYDSQDGDKGVAVFTGKSTSDEAELRSAIIDVPENCSLTFFFNGLAAGNNDRLQLIIDSGNGFENAATYSLNSGSWAMANFDLKNYAGKKIRYGFRAGYVNNGVVLIDNVRISARENKDVAVISCSIPESVKVSTNVKVSANIANLGSENASGVIVNLLVNGNIADTKTVNINSGKEATVELTLNLPVTIGKKAEVSVEAKFDGDTNTANNAIGPCTVELILPNLPSVKDLTGEQRGSGIVLNWSRPSFDGIEVDQITESFEEADAWSSTVENWTLKHTQTAPRMSSTTTGSHVFPGIHGENGGFFVLDGTGLVSDYNAFDGRKAMCSAPTADGSKRVDWLISPELDGSEQRISFSARSVMTIENPGLQLYELDPETNEYVYIQTNYLPNRWVTVNFLVNEGVKHFALCCNTSAVAELLIDNVTFRPDIAVAGLEIAGYNVYCDNNKVNTELITGETFTHKNVEAGSHDYFVTCVSNKGIESAISNVITLTSASIDAVNAAAAVSVAVRDRAIIVNAPADARVQIVAMDGRVVYAGEGNSVVNVTPGIYAVSAAGSVAKVIVR